jgi:hypothetical protein
VQGFGNSPTQISKFLGFGEVYGPTDPGRDQLGTWGLVHMKEYVQLHILLGGCIILCTIGIVGAGVWIFPTEISKILAGKPTLGTNSSSHSGAMEMGVGAY